MDVNIPVNGKMILEMEKELKFLKMVPSLKENLKITLGMEGGFIMLQMVTLMKGTIFRIKRMDMEFKKRGKYYY